MTFSTVFKHRNRKIALILACGLVAALLLSRCHVHLGYFAEDRAAAVEAETVVMQRFNAMQFDKIYDDSSEAMKGAVTRDQAVESIRATFERFGTISEDREAAITCFPNQVRMVRWLKSSRGDELTQISAWDTPGGEAKLIMMQISPGHQTVDLSLVNKHPCNSR